MTDAITIALISLGGAIIGSGGITALVNHILSRKGKTAKQLDHIESEIGEVRDDVKAVEAKVDENEAKRARAQILRFNDELYQGYLHSKEHFDEILAACDAYNLFCDTHPEFENQRTMIAQDKIKDIYAKCMDKHSFLEERK